MKRIFAACAVLALSTSAFAQITSVGPFTGTHSENFDGNGTVVFPQCIPTRVFNSTADLCTINSSGCLVTTGWGFSCTIFSQSAPYFFGSATSDVEFTFDTAVTKFGGYFGTNSNTPDGIVEFYDANNVSLGTATISAAADCNWYWNGWSLATAAKRVRVASNFGGAFMMMDTLEADEGTPAPVVYCTAGTANAGCVASISATGNPNVAHTAPCQLSVANMEGQRSGVIFYGLASYPQPWCSGGSSFLCVKVPLQRSPPQNSNGNLAVCDGSLTLDWNAFQGSFSGLLGTPFNAGDKVYAQGWFRDPVSCKTTSMSDAVELTYQP